MQYKFVFAFGKKLDIFHMDVDPMSTSPMFSKNVQSDLQIYENCEFEKD